jgi:hypothetical protein
VYNDGYNGLLYFSADTTTDHLQWYIWWNIDKELGHSQRSRCGFYRQALDDHICHDYLFAIVTSYMSNLQKNGVIVNKAKMHASTKVLQWIEETNKTKKPQIIYEFIEAGMSSICQPLDLEIKKPLKKATKRQYEMNQC